MSFFPVVASSARFRALRPAFARSAGFKVYAGRFRAQGWGK
jgi:hypothetical protein